MIHQINRNIIIAKVSPYKDQGLFQFIVIQLDLKIIEDNVIIRDLGDMFWKIITTDIVRRIIK